jgi:hypothetical protein
MAILFWYMAVVAMWAAMPKAPVNKNCNLHLGKHEVRPALEREMTAPTSNVKCSQEFDERILSRTVVLRPGFRS